VNETDQLQKLVSSQSFVNIKNLVGSSPAKVGGIEKGKLRTSHFTTTAKEIFTVVNNLINGSKTGKIDNLLGDARILAKSTIRLVSLTKEKATLEKEKGMRNMYLSFAQNLASATSGVAKAAKSVKENSIAATPLLIEAAKVLRRAVYQILAQIALQIGV